MEKSTILTADFLDILFDGRNKAYGAYDLRKTYRKRLTAALAITFSLLLLLYGGYLLAGTNHEQQVTAYVIPDVVVDNIPPPDQPVPPPPPPPRTTEPVKMQIKMFTTPVITQQVDDADKPPTTDELEDVRIGTINQEGVKDDGIVAPPSNEGSGKGVIELPKKINPDSIFMKVEKESEYPGGHPAWARFLNKNLANSYPQQAIDNEVQGTVVVQFLVDIYGNVSDVHGIAGPEALYEAAEKVIRKSGKWIPAIQNGYNVKTYKRQPIVFKLNEE